MSSLVSDGSVPAVKTDANLKNPWGIVFATGAPVWIANNATQTSTLYDGTGTPAALIVQLPGGINGAADATGIVSNSTTDFTVTNGAVTAASRFIFDGEGGTIMGWAPTVDGTHALIAYDDGNGGAVYKGLALAADSGANFLYATDFKNNKVDVFDKAFAKVVTAGGFTDATLPAGYAPFGIQAVQIAGSTVLVVTYAQKSTTSNDNVNGAGLGLVNTFDTKGTLLKHLITVGGKLNAPWGVAMAPAGFGTVSSNLLIGNFGDGVINAFDPSTGAFVDSIKNSAGTAIANAGLWGIAFGNGARNQPTTTLYFAAGIADEVGGLYGRIDLGATAPDIVAPTVALTAPAAASTVSGIVPVTATAADNVGVASVKFSAGATVIGTATAAPFTVNWDTTATTGPAVVALTAQAMDAFGNATTSAAVSVTVNNVAPPPAATTLTELQTLVFTPICSACHTGGGAGLPASMNLSSAAASFAALVNVDSLEQGALKRIAPNDPDNSYLIRKIQGDETINGGRMPLGGTPLDQATINKFRSWVTAGALNN
ncbi:MAG: TIGR03118 family protein [Gammaproteobacteria bacterium]